MRKIAATPTDFRRLTALLALVRAGAGVGPPVREIAAAWGITSLSVTQAALKRIEALGLIRRIAGRARAIEVATHLVPVMTPEGAVLLPASEPVRPQ